MKKQSCGHEDATKSGLLVGGVLTCPDCLLSDYNDLQNEFDLRLVEGSGPTVVHVPTWNKMQPAVDAMGTEIARLCAEMISTSNPDVAKEIRERFGVGSQALVY